MSNKTTILLVRHGQTEWNVEHRLQGHQDSPLTELGVRQAQWLGESLRNEPIDVIYSSTSLRAHRTAELIREIRDIDLHRSDELREINMGIWEGKTQTEVKEKFPDQFYYFWNDPEQFSVQDSETFEEVSSRAVGELTRIRDAHEGKSILLVTHTVVVKLLMTYFTDVLMKDLWNPPYIHPACLCKIVIEDGKPDIVLHGDVSHYKEEPVES